MNKYSDTAPATSALYDTVIDAVLAQVDVLDEHTATAFIDATLHKIFDALRRSGHLGALAHDGFDLLIADVRQAMTEKLTDLLADKADLFDTVEIAAAVTRNILTETTNGRRKRRPKLTTTT